MIELPPQLKYYYDKSLESFHRRHYDYAIEMLKAVIRQAPHFIPAYKLLYQSAENLRKTEAKNPLRAAMRGIQVLYWKLSVHVHMLAKNVHKAQWNYVQGLIVRPDDRQLLKGWLQLAMKQGWLDTAIIPAEALCETDTKHVEGYLLLSSLYLKKGAADSARSVIQRGLANIPTEPQLTRRLKEIEAERTMRRGDWGKT